MDLPSTLTTARLLFRRPQRADADAIRERFAGDPEVTRYLSWPRHLSSEDARDFVAASEREWDAHGTGPYLVVTTDGRVAGATGVHLETPYRASTGYVLAQDAWGRGYATEVACEMAALAFTLPSLVRLYALCHPENAASVRVLEKAGFEHEGRLRRHQLFPNLGFTEPEDVLVYARLRAG